MIAATQRERFERTHAERFKLEIKEDQSSSGRAICDEQATVAVVLEQNILMRTV